MAPPQHVTILGAGLTGLVTAFRLSQAIPSAKITLIDKAERAGGWVGSTRHSVAFKDQDGQDVEGEVTLESGPRSIRPRGSAGAAGMLKLIKDLELEDSIIPVSLTHPAAKNRFLLDPTTSTLTILPSGLSAIAGRQPRLLKGLLPSALAEPFQSRRPPTLHDESVDSFIRRRLGPGIAENMISAMVHGIYATDSRTLSVRAAFPSMWDAESKAGSLILGMIKGTKSKAEKEKENAEWADLGELGKKREGWSLYGLQGGLGALTSRLLREIQRKGVDVRFGETVTSIETTSDGLNIITPSYTFSTNHLISALAPPTLSNLLPTIPHLRHNSYTTVGVLNLVYPLPPSQIHPAGFGYLVPRSSTSLNPQGILGVIFDSTAVPGNDDPRIENKVTKLTMMMGGPWWSTYPASEGKSISPPSDPQDLVKPALDHLHKVFPMLEGVKPLIAVAQIQKDCIPTYDIGHGGRLKDIHHYLVNGGETGNSDGTLGKVSLVGNGYGGVGVNDCVLSAEEVVFGLAADSRPTGLERWENWE